MVARRLRASMAAIAARSIDAMYRDPFWDARFGERGRRFSDEDARRHVQYLAEAVETSYAEPFAIYARWLRSVLTTRGMCSLHIHDNFSRLGDALREEAPEMFQASEPHLEAGRLALLPDEPVALALHQAAVSAPRVASREPFIDDEAFLLSYLADAVTLGRADTFARHLEWICGEADRRGADCRARLERTLTAVEAAARTAGPLAGEFLAAARMACSRTSQA